MDSPGSLNEFPTACFRHGHSQRWKDLVISTWHLNAGPDEN
jgi:hypothetical protein